MWILCSGIMYVNTLFRYFVCEYGCRYFVCEYSFQIFSKGILSFRYVEECTTWQEKESLIIDFALGVLFTLYFLLRHHLHHHLLHQHHGHHHLHHQSNYSQTCGNRELPWILL